MKKFFLLVIFMAAFGSYSFSQPASWGPWAKAACWPGINFRFGVDVPWIPDASEHMVWVEVFNQYNTPISFNLKVCAPSDYTLYQNGTIETTDRVVTLQPGATSRDWGVIVIPSPTAPALLLVDKMRFGSVDSWTAGAFAACNSNFNGPVPSPTTTPQPNQAQQPAQTQQPVQTIAQSPPIVEQPGQQSAEQQMVQLKLEQRAAANRQTQINAANVRKQAAMQTYQQTVSSNQQVTRQNQNDLNNVANTFANIHNQNVADREKSDASQKALQETRQRNIAEGEALYPCMRGNLSDAAVLGCRVSCECDIKYKRAMDFLNTHKGAYKDVSYEDLVGSNLMHYIFHYDAYYYLALYWMNPPNDARYNDAYDNYYISAQGYAPAKYQLALILWKGEKRWGWWKVEKDQNTALKLMRDAANAGVPEAISWVKDHKNNNYLKHPELTIPNVDPNFN
jgi:hypothetical protein